MADSAVPTYTLRDVLALVDGLTVRERENETEGAIRIDETKATVLGLALGATFTTAMEMVEAVAVVVFAAGDASEGASEAASEAASEKASEKASAADAAAESFLNFAYSSLNFLHPSLNFAPSSPETANPSLNFAPSPPSVGTRSLAAASLEFAPAALGVPALTVADHHCRHVVDLNAWYCTCGMTYGSACGSTCGSCFSCFSCPHLVAAAIAVRNRLVSAHHTTWPALPWGPLPVATVG